MDNLYLRKYLKYKLKYNKIKGGMIDDNYNMFKDKCKNTGYFLSEENFCAGEDEKLVKLETAAEGNYNDVFKTTKLPNSILLKAKKPTYDFDEIELLISLNEINKTSGENIFTPFQKIIFDETKLEYYLEFKLYTSDLDTYLKKLFSDVSVVDKDKLIRLLDSINEILNKKLEILLGIGNLTCLDIKLTNILISYDETNFDIKEIVLHDFDMVSCCTRSIKETDKTEKQNCTILPNTNTYLSIYYKLILFCQSYKIIHSSTQNISYREGIQSLFQGELKAISIEKFEEFFGSFINSYKYRCENNSIATLPIKEKMHLFFDNNVLASIRQLNPQILKSDIWSNTLLKIENWAHTLLLSCTKREEGAQAPPPAPEVKYVHLLPVIFKNILDENVNAYLL